MIKEINRKYENNADQATDIDDVVALSRSRRSVLGIIALVLALMFLFTVVGRGIYVFVGPPLEFLTESWSLSDDPVVLDSRESVVQVNVETRSGAPGGQTRATGFNIDPGGLIVTNRHVIEDAMAVRVSFPGRGTYSAREIHVSPHVDLGLIELEAEDLPSVPLSGRSAQPGDELLIIGNPLQFARIANMGVLLGYAENHNRDIPILVVEAAVYPGSSGSPLFNEQGEVVGVVYATRSSNEPSEVIGLAVDVRELDIFLDDLSGELHEPNLQEIYVD